MSLHVGAQGIEITPAVRTFMQDDRRDRVSSDVQGTMAAGQSAEGVTDLTGHKGVIIRMGAGNPRARSDRAAEAAAAPNPLEHAHNGDGRKPLLGLARLNGMDEM